MALSGISAIGLEWMFVGVTLLFVLLRCYIRFFRQGDFKSPADYLIIIAFLLFASSAACDTFVYSIGLMEPRITYFGDLASINPDKKIMVTVLKVLYASALPYYTDLWLVKSALLVFYYSIIPKNMKRQRFILHIVSGTVGITYISVLLANAFACMPLPRNWSLDESSCFSYAQPGVFGLSVGSNVVTDLMIFTLPFPLLPTIKLAKRSQLYGLIFIFGLGFLCIIASVSRCIALANHATVTDVAIWTAAECSTGIMVACSPALRMILRNKPWRKADSHGSGADNKFTQSPTTMRGAQRNAAAAWSRIDDDDLGRSTKRSQTVISMADVGSNSDGDGGVIRKSVTVTTTSSMRRIRTNDGTEEINMRDLESHGSMERDLESQGAKDETMFHYH